MSPAFDRDLLALYVLGALEPAEAAPIDAALAAGDAETVASVAEARRLAAAIGLSAPKTAPPAGARDRLLERLRREGAGAPAASSRAAPGGGTTPPRPRRSWFAPAVVTAVFVILAALSVYNGLTERRIDDLVVRIAKAAMDPASVRYTFRPADDPKGAPLGVVWFTKSGDLLVFTENLPKAPADMSYVLWTLRGGVPTNRGTLRPSVAGGPGLILEQAPGPADLDAVAVSLESDPRTPTPTAVKAVAQKGS